MMLNFIVTSVIMLSAFYAKFHNKSMMLNVIMMSVIMPNVVAPKNFFKIQGPLLNFSFYSKLTNGANKLECLSSAKVLSLV